MNLHIRSVPPHICEVKVIGDITRYDVVRDPNDNKIKTFAIHKSGEREFIGEGDKYGKTMS